MFLLGFVFLFSTIFMQQFSITVEINVVIKGRVSFFSAVRKSSVSDIHTLYFVLEKAF